MDEESIAHREGLPGEEDWECNKCQKTMTMEDDRFCGTDGWICRNCAKEEIKELVDDMDSIDPECRLH